MTDYRGLTDEQAREVSHNKVKDAMNMPDMTVITVFENLSAFELDRHSNFWKHAVDVFAKEPLRQRKHECRLFCMASFGAKRTNVGALRSNDNIEFISGLTGDHDAGTMPIEQAIERLERAGIKAIVYPSASWTADHPRWRVVAPLYRSVMVKDHTHLMNRLNGALAGVLAGESWTASQAFFFGPIDGKPYTVHSTFDDPEEGEYIDRLDELDQMALPKQALGGNAPKGIEAVSSARAITGRPLREGDGRREFLKSMIASRSSAGATKDELVAEVRAAIDTHFDATDPVDWSNIEKMIDHFVRKDASKHLDLSHFDEVPSPIDETGAAIRSPNYRKVPGKGRYAGYKASTTEQIALCIESDPVFPWRVCMDSFFQERMILVKQTQKFERLQDHHITEARIWFDSNFWEPITSQNMREILHACAMRAKSNVARDWLESQQWDGTDRIPEFLKRLRVKQDPYTLSVARYMWTAMAGRVYEPGCQADSIIVLLGPQGVGKTRAFNAIAPVICGERTVREITINMLLSDDSSARAMRGTIIANMDEMRYVTKKEASDVKAALSRSHESYIPKYMESRMSFGRTGIICGTGNEFEILDDSTGSRRYYILEVKDTIDVDWIAFNSPQLWAQGLTDYKSNGVAWQEAQNLAPDATAENRIEDPWEDAIAEYVSKRNLTRMTSPDIMSGALGLPTDKMDLRAKKRVAGVMHTLGWRQVFTTEKGTRKNFRVWAPPEDDAHGW